MKEPKIGLKELDTLFTPRTPTTEEMDKLSRVESVPLSLVMETESDALRKSTPGSPGALIKGYGDMPVAAHRLDGHYVLFDGHNRTLDALAKGDEFLQMYVIDLRSYDPTSDKRSSPARSLSPNDLLDELYSDQDSGMSM